MFFKVVFLIVGLSQVLALPTAPEYTEVDFIENVLKVESELESSPDVDPSGMRIVSGWPAYPGQHPHQIYLRMINDVGVMSACGASVVHSNWFITAAHCTALRVRLLVRAGLVHISQPEYDEETTVWYNHPTYVDSLPNVVQPNDISIAHVEKPFTFNHVLQPIKMQSSADANKDYSNRQVMASGFGRIWSGGATSDVLNWVYLNGVSNTQCSLSFGAIVTDTTICARFFNVTSQSTCQGDSGGPLVDVDDDGVPVLIGVAAFVAGGDAGCHSGHPAGFTRPGPFQGWFTEVTGIDFENLDEPTTTEPPTEGPTTTEEPSTTEPPTEPLTTENPDSDESGEDSAETPEPDQDSSEEKDSSEENDSSEEKDDDDCELSELLKKLEVNVKVNVKLNKYGRRKKHTKTN